MLEKRRSVRVSTKTSIGDEIAHLRGLDLKGLCSRWQSVFQRPPPGHLPRHLIFATIAYRIQADRVGDLDHAPLPLFRRLPPGRGKLYAGSSVLHRRRESHAKRLCRGGRPAHADQQAGSRGAVHALLPRPATRNRNGAFRLASEFYGQVQRYAELPFWRARSASFDRPAAQPTSALVDPGNLSSCSLETCVQISRDARLVKGPCILDNQICSQQALVHPNMCRPVAFMEDVAISPLLERVASSADLGSLLANWSSLVSPYKARRIADWLLKNRILE